MRIGEFSHKAGVTEQTIRYYERLGLLSASRRTTRGFRRFSSDDLERIRLIKGFQALNMPLEDIVSLFHIWRESTTGDEARRNLSSALEEQVERLAAKLEQYNELRGLLRLALEQSARCKKCGKKPSKELCSSCPRIMPGEKKPVPSLSAFF